MVDSSAVQMSWIPVVGTLLGAALGLFGSTAVAWINHRNSESKAKSDRKRERLEDLYRTLVAVRKDYQDLVHGAISKAHGDSTPKTIAHDGIPPIIKTEMLVKLYFPQLGDEYRQFIKTRDSFGAEWARFIGENTQSWPLQKRQQKSSQFMDLFEAVDQAIQSLQDAVAGAIEA